MANMTYTEAGYQHSSQLNLAARVDRKSVV